MVDWTYSLDLNVEIHLIFKLSFMGGATRWVEFTLKLNKTVHGGSSRRLNFWQTVYDTFWTDKNYE